MSNEPNAAPGPQIRLKTDRSSPIRSTLPLPSWSSLTGSRSKVVSSEPPHTFFRRDDDRLPTPASTSQRRFGDLVDAHVGSLDRSTWRRPFRFLRPFSGPRDENTTTAVLRWLFRDESPDTPIAHERDGESDEFEEISEAIVATPELNVTGAFARRGSTAAAAGPLMPSQHRRRGSSVAPVHRLQRKAAPPPSSSSFLSMRSQTVSWRRRLGLSRFAVGLLFVLLLFGLREVWRGNSSRDPRRLALQRVRTTRWIYSPRTLLHTLRLPQPPKPRNVLPAARSQLDTTAIILTYQRRSNLLVTLAHLCQYLDSPFREILVWNNDPVHQYSFRDLKATGCPADRVRLFNSPDNMLFVARYLACAQTATPYCYFQDDDYLVWPLRAMYAQFSRDPEGPIVVAGGTALGTSTSSDLYTWRRCFFQPPRLHSCHAWLGAGAFVSKSAVLEFLRTGLSSTSPSRGAMTATEVGLADNAFSTLLNRPAYVLSHAQISLVAQSDRGFSDGSDGEARNQRYISQGAQRLLSQPSLGQDSRSLGEEDYRSTRPPPLAPHPHAYHSKAPCSSDTCLFITNVPMLPSPTSPPLATSMLQNFSLAQWETRGETVWADLLRWSSEYAYSAAVDDDYATAWRSPDVIRRGDYVGLMLVDLLDVSVGDGLIDIDIAMDDVEDVLAGGLDVEVSRDGYRWIRTGGTAWSCRALAHRSRPPPHSFPQSPNLSPLASRLRHAESGWRTKRAERIRLCSLTLSRELPRDMAASLATSPPSDESARGWRFVRAVYAGKESAAVGWVIWEISLTT